MIILIENQKQSLGRNWKRTKTYKLGKRVDFGQSYILCKLFSKIVNRRRCKQRFCVQRRQGIKVLKMIKNLTSTSAYQVTWLIPMVFNLNALGQFSRLNFGCRGQRKKALFQETAKTSKFNQKIERTRKCQRY